MTIRNFIKLFLLIKIYFCHSIYIDICIYIHFDILLISAATLKSIRI